jgi:hypothetical protein
LEKLKRVNGKKRTYQDEGEERSGGRLKRVTLKKEERLKGFLKIAFLFM